MAHAYDGINRPGYGHLHGRTIAASRMSFRLNRPRASPDRVSARHAFAVGLAGDESLESWDELRGAAELQVASIASSSVEIRTSFTQ